LSSSGERWFISERSEALAGVLLTSRKDVRIRDKERSAGELDFLVEIDTGVVRRAAEAAHAGVRRDGVPG
jgi:hypothetical protein